MSQEDVAIPPTPPPRPQDGGYVSVLCRLLGDIQSFRSALPVWLGIHSLGWRGWLHLFKVGQGRLGLIDWQTGGETGSSAACDLLVLFKAGPTHPAMFLPLTGVKPPGCASAPTPKQSCL